MLNFFYELTTPWAKSNGVQIIQNKILGKLANFIYIPYCHFRKIHQTQDECDVVISLTSFPKRINALYYTLNSLLRQSVRPKGIILWLANEQFPGKIENVPKRIKKLEQYGLKIKFCEDLRSYKKIFYTAQEYTDENIVIVDDDTLYQENWLEKMWNTHLKNPGAIVCYRAHGIVFNDDGSSNYKKWDKLAPTIVGPDMSIMAVGVGGVLYPAGFFKDVCWNFDDIRRIAYTTDDIWLKCLSVKKRVPTVKVYKDSKEFFTVINSQKERLVKLNDESGNANDISFCATMKYFGLKQDDFKRS